MFDFATFFEASQCDKDDLDKMINNPDPKRIKEYGDDKYIKMLKKKRADLDSEDQEDAMTANDIKHYKKVRKPTIPTKKILSKKEKLRNKRNKKVEY